MQKKKLKDFSAEEIEGLSPYAVLMMFYSKALEQGWTKEEIESAVEEATEGESNYYKFLDNIKVYCEDREEMEYLQTN